MLHRFVLICTAIFAVGFCAAQDTVSADSINTPALVSIDLLEYAGMEQDWRIDLPLKRDENIDRMQIFDKYLYVLTDSNYLFCLDRAKGTVRFGLDIALAGLPVCDPHYDGLNLIFMVGSRLLIVNPNTGTITDSKELENIGRSAACAIASNDESYFIPGSNRRLSTIVKDGLWRRFSVTADNDSLINSVLADNDIVIFSTLTGNVIAMTPNKQKKLWQFDGPNGIIAPVVRDDTTIYVSSEDAKLYKLDIDDGKHSWETPFQAGLPLSTSARIGKKHVYQYAGKKGLYAINKATGKKLWQLDKGLDLLTEKADKAYLFASPGVLVVKDNVTADTLYSVNLSEVTDYAVNTTDSTIYLADDNGQVISVTITK